MEPRIENRDAFFVMGVTANGDPSSMNYDEIWEQFIPYDEQVKKLSIDGGYYNVYFATADEGIVDLIAGMMVEDTSNAPEGLVAREVPAMRCAIFECTMKGIGETYSYIYDEWLPKSQYEHDETPDFEYFAPDSGSENPSVLIHVGIKES